MVENITNLSEARYCAGMGVFFLGFPVQSVDPKLYQDITGWVQGPEMVLDVSACLEIPSNLNVYASDHILVVLDQLNSIPSDVPSLIVKLRPGQLELADLVKSREKISYIIADGLSTSEVKSLLANRFAILVSMNGYGATDFNELLEWAEGVVLSGSQEDKPGLKDYDHLSSLLEQLEINDD